MVCNHFKGMSPRPESGVPRMRDKIIKSADSHAQQEVRTHDFPDFTAGHDTPGELFSKTSHEFKQEFFSIDQVAAAYPNKPSVSSASPDGSRGKSATIDDGNASIRLLLSQVQQAIAAMETVTGELDRQMEKTVGLLALGLAEIMVNHAAETNPDVVLGSLSRALQKGQGQTIRKIRLNPTDMELTEATREKLSGMVEHMEDLQLETDVALSRGGCVVETDYGTIDVTPENQFRVLTETLRSLIGPAATFEVQQARNEESPPH